MGSRRFTAGSRVEQVAGAESTCRRRSRGWRCWKGHARAHTGGPGQGAHLEDGVHVEAMLGDAVHPGDVGGAAPKQLAAGRAGAGWTGCCSAEGRGQEVRAGQAGRRHQWCAAAWPQLVMWRKAVGHTAATSWCNAEARARPRCPSRPRRSPAVLSQLAAVAEQRRAAGRARQQAVHRRLHLLLQGGRGTLKRVHLSKPRPTPTCGP